MDPAVRTRAIRVAAAVIVAGAAGCILIALSDATAVDIAGIVLVGTALVAAVAAGVLRGGRQRGPRARGRRAPGTRRARRVIEAVVFDLDGVLIDSEQLWDAARRELVEERGGRWRDSATTDMLGMSSREWPRYVRDELGVEADPDTISREVVARVAESYRRELPLLPGAVEAVRRVGERRPLGLATSANREIIELFLDLAGLRESFAVTLSTEEVGEGAGKPTPTSTSRRAPGWACRRAMPPRSRTRPTASGRRMPPGCA